MDRQGSSSNTWDVVSMENLQEARSKEVQKVEAVPIAWEGYGSVHSQRRHGMNMLTAPLPCLPVPRVDRPFLDWLGETHRDYHNAPPSHLGTGYHMAVRPNTMLPPANHPRIIHYRTLDSSDMLQPDKKDGFAMRNRTGNQNSFNEMSTYTKESMSQAQWDESRMDRIIAWKLAGRPQRTQAQVPPVSLNNPNSQSVEEHLANGHHLQRHGPTFLVEQPPKQYITNRGHNPVIQLPQGRKRAWSEQFSSEENNEFASSPSKRRRENEGDTESDHAREIHMLTTKVERYPLEDQKAYSPHISPKERDETISTNGVSILLALPLEIRNRLYHHILSATRYDPLAGKVTTNSKAHSIFRVNRQINREISQYFIKNREWDFYISDIANALDLFDIIQPPPPAGPSSAERIENVNLVLAKDMLKKEERVNRETTRLGKEIDGVNRVGKKHPLYYLANAMNWMPALRNIRVEIEEFNWQENEDNCGEERYSMGPFLKLLRGTWKGPIILSERTTIENNEQEVDVLYYSREPSLVSSEEIRGA